MRNRLPTDFLAAAILAAAVFCTPVRALEPAKTSLLVMFVHPRSADLAAAARGARAGLIRVLEGLKFEKLYSPDDLAVTMKIDEFRKAMEDRSTGNLMALGKRIGASKVVYGELESRDNERILHLSLLPPEPKGPIRFDKASYPVNAEDEVIDFEIAKAVIRLMQL